MEQPTTDQPSRIRKFYDGGCPLCRREVAHYRRLDQRGRIDWADIGRDPETLAALGVTLEQAMARPHGQDRDDRLVTAVRAFAAIWDELPGYRHLERLSSFSGIAPETVQPTRVRPTSPVMLAIIRAT